jgi:nitroreductase
MDPQSLESLIKSRRSIRRWRQTPVPDDLILKAIELATWAPNGGNRQNWNFVVITARNLIIEMADIVQSRVDTIASWPEAHEHGATLERWRKSSAFFRNAPVCIAVFMTKYESLADQILKVRVRNDSSVQGIIDGRQLTNSGLQSVSSAVGYLLLALHAQGLGGIWMTGPLLAKKELEEVLRAPEGRNLVALVSVGYPDERPTQTRKPVAEVVEFRR